MKLGDLIAPLQLKKGAESLGELTDLDISGVSCDSRTIKEGEIFVALRGSSSRGSDFIGDAIEAGAGAILCEDEGSVEGGGPVGGAVPRLIAEDGREALGLLASTFYGNPSEGLRMVGITGTNGKTTTSYLVESVLQECGARTGVIGTVSYRYGSREVAASHTTPGAIALQSLLGDMSDGGVTDVVLEVSSHALEQRRTYGCSFEVGVFTNLTREHLDYHRTMEDYYDAKRLLFKSLTEGGKAVINIDDEWGEKLAMEVEGSLGRDRVLAFSLFEGGDIYPESSAFTSHGIEAMVHTPDGPLVISSPIIGVHNLYNILAAIGVGTALGLGKGLIAKGIDSLSTIPGRLEKVPLPKGSEDKGVTVFVDYGHTPDGLEKALETVHSLLYSRGRLITVFGCGGDRDKGKRAKMGRVAVKYSDITVVTSDNPRTESPEKIIRDIEEGMTDVKRYVHGIHIDYRGYYVFKDRREAINEAIAIAGDDDMVLIAGKGHEDYQLIGTKKTHFDDREVAAHALRRKYS